MAIILLTLALSIVFYATHMAGTLTVKTLVAASGFALLFITLFYVAAPV